MHDARAISNFFIDRSIDVRAPITALSLLKILYFSHAWHLVKYGSPLVAQPFEAWKFGPVVRVVYDQIKMKRSMPIEEALVVLNPIRGQYEKAVVKRSTELTYFMENIFDYYSKYSALQLSDLTHEVGSPWDLIWRKAEISAVPGMRIPDEMIRNWFASESARRSTRQTN